MANWVLLRNFAILSRREKKKVFYDWATTGIPVITGFEIEIRTFCRFWPILVPRFFSFPFSNTSFTCHVTSPNQGLFLNREGKGKEPRNEDDFDRHLRIFRLPKFPSKTWILNQICKTKCSLIIKLRLEAFIENLVNFDAILRSYFPINMKIDPSTVFGASSLWGKHG
jgi:hypothetical protein